MKYCCIISSKNSRKYAVTLSYHYKDFYICSFSQRGHYSLSIILYIIRKFRETRHIGFIKIIPKED